MTKDLTESLEKYLLAIFELLKEKKDVKVKDVASYLNIGGPATADAVKTLAARGYINYAPYKNISVTAKGASAIEIKKYRHNTICKFLNKVLDISEKEAEKNAKIIEYSMTENVLVKFVHFLDFMEQCSCKEPKWIKSCKSALKDGKLSQNCKNCSKGSSCGCCQH